MDHVSIYLDHNEQQILYDPDGGYQPAPGYSSDHVGGEILDYDSYLDYHRQNGGEVKVLEYSLSVDDARIIYNRIDSMPTAAPSFSCATSVSQIISGVGVFKDVPAYNGITRPGTLYESMPK
jgi:hypothetical protein